ncbi:MAG TPA: hypothetical protein VM912_09835 [Terriglobales bacterium]|nr:hypothetical protein [Terriglobales bacterium]
MTAAPADSSHFDAWMTLVGAGIALAASLATAALSSFFENRRDAARRAHADQAEATRWQHESAVRFHDERLRAYVEFVGATLHLAASAGVWAGSLRARTFLDSVGSELNAYVRSLARVRMLAKPPLMQRLQNVHDLVVKLLDSPEAESIATELMTASGQFEVAAKKELGIN